jgi:hypothetical protein
VNNVPAEAWQWKGTPRKVPVLGFSNEFPLLAFGSTVPGGAPLCAAVGAEHQRPRGPDPTVVTMHSTRGKGNRDRTGLQAANINRSLEHTRKPATRKGKGGSASRGRF